MSEAEAILPTWVPGDDDAAVMHGVVVRSAHEEQVARVVAAGLRAVDLVVQVDPGGVATARDLAAAVIAAGHGGAGRRRQVYRSQDGDHDPGNLLLLCTAHHHAVHEDRLIITRHPRGYAFHHADGTVYGVAPAPAGAAAPA